MHRISGRIIRPFLYPVSGRIPDCPAGYPVRLDTGLMFRWSNNLFGFSSKRQYKQFNLVTGTRSCYDYCLQKSIPNC
jgi:hypothetical protein